MYHLDDEMHKFMHLAKDPNALNISTAYVDIKRKINSFEEGLVGGQNLMNKF